MRVSFAKLRRQAEETLQDRLSADLRGLPVRVLLASQIKGWSNVDFLGFACPALPEVFHRELRITGKADRPVVFAINDRAIDQMVRQRHPYSVQRHHVVRHWFHATAAHEMAHCIEHMPLRTIAETHGGIADYPKSETTRFVSEVRDKPVVERKPWDGHDQRYIRILCHVIDRTYRPLNYSPATTFDHDIYQVSPLWRYMSALRPELRSAEAICDITKTRAPKTFQELWASDVAKWEASQAATN